MRNLKITLFVPTILLLSFLMVVFARQPDNRSIPKHRLAIEIGLNKPWTVNAAAEGHTLRAFVRVPANAKGESPFSAIKLEPKMVGDKLEVTVSVLSGDTSAIKSCKDWSTLKESPVTSLTLREGEETTVSQLSNLGPNFKNGILTLRAVSFVAPDIEPIDGGTDCGCGRCDRLYCCPNAGSCLGCGTCGDVCCGK
jgi:hypothetical protein